MKNIRILSFLALVTGMIVLTGCPYSSEVPIDQASIVPASTLLGKWKTSETTKSFYEVKIKDKFYFDIDYNEWNSDTKAFEHKYYNGFLSNIDKVQFLNIWNINEITTIYLYKITHPNESKVVLNPISEYVTEKFSNSAELKAFIKKNMNLSFFFESDDKYIKVI